MKTTNWLTLLFTFGGVCLLFGGGCLTQHNGGCAPVLEDDVGTWRATVTTPDKLFTTSAVTEHDYIVQDRYHACEYVVIKNSVFCWRGTNLIAYTQGQ